MIVPAALGVLPGPVPAAAQEKQIPHVAEGQAVGVHAVVDAVQLLGVGEGQNVAAFLVYLGEVEAREVDRCV